MKFLKKLVAVAMAAVIGTSSLGVSAVAAEKSDKLEIYSYSWDNLEKLAGCDGLGISRTLLLEYKGSGDNEKFSGFSKINMNEWQTTGKFSISEVKTDFSLNDVTRCYISPIEPEDRPKYEGKDEYFTMERKDGTSFTAYYDVSADKVKKLVDVKGVKMITADGYTIVETKSEPIVGALWEVHDKTTVTFYYMKKEVFSFELDDYYPWRYSINYYGDNIMFGYKRDGNLSNDNTSVGLEYFTVKETKKGVLKLETIADMKANDHILFSVVPNSFSASFYPFLGSVANTLFYSADKDEIIFWGDSWNVRNVKSDKYGDKHGYARFDGMEGALNGGTAVFKYMGGTDSEPVYSYALVDLKGGDKGSSSKIKVETASAYEKTSDGKVVTYAGELLTELYSDICNIGNGYYHMVTASKKMGVLNSSGKVVLKANYTDITEFNGDYLFVVKGGKAYFLNNKFKTVSESAKAKWIDATDTPDLFMYGGTDGKTYVATIQKIDKKPDLGKPVLKVKKGATKATLTWSEVKGAEKYQIYYSVNGGKYKKLTTTSKLTKTVKGLDFSKNTYKFKIRAIAEGGDGKTYTGSFSKVVTVKK